MTHFVDVLVLALLHAVCLAGAMTFVLALAMLYERKWAPPRREDYLRAIEFAEYMAKAAEDLQAKVNAYHRAIDAEEAEGDPDGEFSIDLALAWGNLNCSIYDFRKRAMRAVVPTDVVS